MIHVTHLTKKYGRTTAVDDISFEVQHGEIVGYLGPNGAGKSTTLKMLVGLLQPTSGEISVAGYNAETELLELKQRIGYVPEEAQLYESQKQQERQLFGSLGSMIMLVVLLLRDSSSYLTWPHHSGAIGLSPGFSGIFYFIGTGIVSGFILPVRYSEHWKASWMLRLAPLSAPNDL